MIEAKVMEAMAYNQSWQPPSGWKVKSLSQVATTKSGGTPSRRNPRYFNGNIPWIKSGELEDDWILDSQEKITTEAIINSSAKIFPKGTLLLAMYGATAGKLGILGIDAATNQAICAIFPNEDLDRDFLFFYLMLIRRNILQSSTGGAQPNISQTFINRLLVPIPPLTVQQRIVSRIKALLADLKEAQSTLDSMRHDIGQVMNSASREVFKEVSKNNELVSLGPHTTKIGSGSTPRGANYEETGIPFIRSLNVLWNKFTDKDLKFISPTVHKRMRGTEVRVGDTLLNITGASIGRSCCPPEKYLPANVNQHVTIIRPTKELRSRFLMYWLTNPDTQQIIDGLQSGATRQALTRSQIAQFQIPLPDTILQERIVNYLDSIQEGVNELQDMLREDEEILQQVEQGILNQAFRGEL